HCEAPAARAVVAVAPLVPRNRATTVNRALLRWGTRVNILRGRPVSAPRGRLAIEYLATQPPGGTAPEASRVLRQLAADDFPLSTDRRVPKLLLAGEHDAFCPPRDVERLAAHLGAESRVMAGGGHAMPWDTGWERLVAEVHRWLIHTLGDPLLA